MNTRSFIRSLLLTPRFVTALIFVGALALYIRTACPTLGGAFDSEEFQHVAYTLGIAHATGYPLYLLIGKIFTTLIPIGNIAYRMNLLSALLTALAVTFVYLNAQMITQRPLAAIATTALFATNPAVWRQAGVASIGPLHLLLLNAILYALWRWGDARADTRSAPIVAAFLVGLGLAHHRTTLLFAPAIAILVLLVDANILRRPRDIAKTIFWLIVPLALYLYLPLFGSASPWYSNSLSGFLAQINGGDAGAFIRATPEQIVEGVAIVTQYLFDSFGYLGLILIVVGSISHTIRNSQSAIRKFLFLGIATLLFSIWGTLYAGEPDRYLVLPFAFLIYWFALGVSAIQNRAVTLSEGKGFAIPKTRFLAEFTLSGANALRMTAQTTFTLILVFFIALPFADRFRIADWSAFDRVYKQWDEIFTLPLPPNATIVGNWGQLNAMRFMQRVEGRRTNLQAIGTLYDPAPQTQAAHAAFADGRAIFLAPGIAQPIGDYRYAQLGPLLEVRDAPQMQPPAAQKNIAINPSLTLANYEITTALEPFAPTTSIAPTRSVRVTLDWRANGSVKEFLVRVRLYDPDGRAIVQRDEPPVRGLYAPSQWSRGEYVRDVHNVQIPAGTPPGMYQLKIQTLDAQTKAPTSDEIALTSFAVERATNLTREQVFIAHPLDIALDDHISIWGYGGFDGTHRAGETLSGNLVFYAREDVGADLALTLALTDTTDKIAQTWQNPPIAFHPTHEWKKGEVLKAYYELRLPANLPAGIYVLAVGFDSPQIEIVKLEITP